MNIFDLAQGWGTETAFVFSALVFILMSLMVIPLQVKEALVKNGLIALRRQMLIGGVTIFVSNLAILFTLIELLLEGITITPRAEFFQVVSSLSFLILAITYRNIYHQQFSDKQKHIHKIASDIERKENKK